MKDYRIEFSISGELFHVTVTARNRASAKRTAWDDARSIVNADRLPAMVMRSCNAMFVY